MSESVSRVMKQHGMITAIKPVQTIRNYLVNPKDKSQTGETTECVYTIPCKNCSKSYIGEFETSRKLDDRVKKHKKGSESTSLAKGHHTRAATRANLTERHKSMITDPLRRTIMLSIGRSPGLKEENQIEQ